MSGVWRAKLKELLEAENTQHNTAAALHARDEKFSGNAQNLAAKTAKTSPGLRGRIERLRKNPQARKNPTAKTAKTPADLSAFAKRKLEQASELGLAAMWSR